MESGIASPRTDLPLREPEAFAALLAEREEIEGFAVRRETLDGICREHLALHGLHFDGCRFAACKLCRSNLSDITFIDCDLSNCDLTGCSFERVRFERCRLTGLALPESYLHHVCLLYTSDAADD